LLCWGLAVERGESVASASWRGWRVEYRWSISRVSRLGPWRHCPKDTVELILRRRWGFERTKWNRRDEKHRLRQDDGGMTGQ